MFLFAGVPSMAESAEERQSELEALSSIYEHNLHLIRDNGLQKFEVHLTGHGGGSDVSTECTITFEYTEEYPSQAPLYEISKCVNLSEHECAQIEELIESAIQRCLGYIMIFDVLSEVQEKINSICENRLAMRVKAEEAREKARELEEEAKFRGDRVTVESFLEWNAKFLAEMAALKEKNKAADETGQKRLTGREMFLRDNRYDDSDLKFLAENGEQVAIDESLFADIDLTDDLVLEDPTVVT
ncbi:hypothetical protein T265_10746 [Opisthorchis viverrini]|uniref:RWD domain-containing protein n=1 Tax=Opisthorchis viverrini TaxID=6198 RepID=A0A074Z156_OPIVI|nr:hypothetical protein T265_10746 [Opisthorchis viverrini]KER20776.1 hypothetical protein T265_10746 [Opisthorchis viverrini]